MIQVTERAAQKAIQLAEREGRPKVLRIGVRGGGCSGFSYFLEFTEDFRPDDAVTEVGELKVLCDPKSVRLMDGTELDYETSLLKAGFRFTNPQAQRTCSCGESFAI